MRKRSYEFKERYFKKINFQCKYLYEVSRDIITVYNDNMTFFDPLALTRVSMLDAVIDDIYNKE